MVNDTVAQYTASKKDPNVSPSTLKTINADTIIYPNANVQTALSASPDFFITLNTILMLFEYLNALNTLKTLIILKILRSLNSLNPLLNTDSDGNIDTRSIIAHGVNGYLTKDTTPFPTI